MEPPDLVTARRRAEEEVEERALVHLSFSLGTSTASLLDFLTPIVDDARGTELRREPVRCARPMVRSATARAR